jgi:hypothetical protein
MMVALTALAESKWREACTAQRTPVCGSQTLRETVSVRSCRAREMSSESFAASAGCEAEEQVGAAATAGAAEARGIIIASAALPRMPAATRRT